MARETKIAMLIGLGVILLIGIIISDHLATVQGTGGGESIAQFGQRADRSLGEAEEPEQARRDAEAAAARVASELNRAIPRPEELDGETEPPVGAYDAPPPTDLRAMRVEPSGRAWADGSRIDRRGEGGATRDASDASDATRRPGVGVPQSIEFSRAARLRAEREQAQAAERAAASSPADDRASAEGGRVIHYLAEGETLYDVARKYLGDGDEWEAIVAANREAVPNPDRVTPGLRLVIPASAEDVPRRSAIEAAASSGTSEPAVGKTIEVQPGDTLYEIAQAYLGDGKRWREILAINDKLERDTDLRSGMSIKLPPLHGASIPNGGATTGGVATGSERNRPRAESARETPEPSRATTYEVKPGDTLGKIARRVLGDADRWEDVYAANRDRLDDPDAIRAGQTLRIPR